MRSTTATVTWKPPSRHFFSAPCAALSAASGVSSLIEWVPWAEAASGRAARHMASRARFMGAILRRAAPASSARAPVLVLHGQRRPRDDGGEGDEGAQRERTVGFCLPLTGRWNNWSRWNVG